MRFEGASWLALPVLVAFAACGAPATGGYVAAGCTKDTDCKGDRVCVMGECLPPMMQIPIDMQLTRPDDLGESIDASSRPDLRFPADLAPAQDMTPAPDLTVLRDLAPPPDLSVPLPKQVTVRFTGATVAPFKSDATQWDGFGKVDQKAIDGLALALGAVNPFLSVGTFLINPAIAALEKPDPFGTVEVSVNGQLAKQDLATINNNQEDTFTPIWPGGPGWMNVPLDPSLRFTFTVFDEDLQMHDGVGVAQVNYNDVVAALKLGMVYQVQVSAQTNNQLLFVGMTVTP